MATSKTPSSSKRTTKVIVLYDETRVRREILDRICKARHGELIGVHRDELAAFEVLTLENSEPSDPD